MTKSKHVGNKGGNDTAIANNEKGKISEENLVV